LVIFKSRFISKEIVPSRFDVDFIRAVLLFFTSVKRASICSDALSAGDFVEDLWYDKELLEANYDFNDTTGKSYEAAVGWITDKWRDEYIDPEDGDLSEYWEEHEENLAWELENGS